VLRSQEKIVVLVKQRTVEGNESLPLLVVELGVVCVILRVLCVVHFDALVFHHYKASIDPFDLSNKLFLGNGSRLRLLDQLG